MVLVLLLLCFAIGGMLIAKRRGGSAVGGFLLGLFLGPFGLLFALFLGGMQCPYCRKSVHLEAVVCPHCHRELRAIEAPTKERERQAVYMHADYLEDERARNLARMAGQKDSRGPEHRVQRVAKDQCHQNAPRLFRITGVDHASGFQTDLVLEAASERDAREKATERGIFVEKVLASV